MPAYRHPRYHQPRPDTTRLCPDPEHCAHTTDVPGEGCECCGQTPTLDIGTVTDAAVLLSTDSAQVWELVAAGRLVATRERDSEPWLIAFPAARS